MGALPGIDDACSFPEEAGKTCRCVNRLTRSREAAVPFPFYYLLFSFDSGARTRSRPRNAPSPPRINRSFTYVFRSTVRETRPRLFFCS